MSALELGSALEELIRRIVRDELTKHGGKVDDTVVDDIAELVEKDAAAMRAARGRPAPDRRPRAARRGGGAP